MSDYSTKITKTTAKAFKKEMGSIFSRTGKITAVIIDIVVNIANLFLGNILVFEATAKSKFDWEKLLHSYLFWAVIVANIIYYSIAHVVNQKAHKVDEATEKLTEKFIADMYDLAMEEMRQRNYESSKKVLKELRKIQRRRRK